MAFIAKIRYTIQILCDRIKKAAESYEYYMALFQEEETKLLFRKCKTRLFKVLKSIRPRKIEANLTAGTGSPDTTGYMLALYGILSPHLGNTVCVIPDFEQAILQGNFRIRGKITLFILIVTTLKLYFDKQLRAFIVKLKREDI